MQVGRFEATYPDGRKTINEVVFDPYAAAPTVKISLSTDQARVSAQYVGPTRLSVIEE